MVYLSLPLHCDHSSLKHYDLLTDRTKNPESSGCLVLLPHGKAPECRLITPEMTPVQPEEQQHSVTQEAVIVNKYVLLRKFFILGTC